MSKPPFDGFSFFFQFFFGVILGCALGFGAWAKSPQATSTSLLPAFIYLGFGAFIGGLSAGIYGDRFWRALKNFWW